MKKRTCYWFRNIQDPTEWGNSLPECILVKGKTLCVINTTMLWEDYVSK